MAKSLPEVYTSREIAQAAGVADAQVIALLERGMIRSVGDLLPSLADPSWSDYVPHAEAVRAVRSLRAAGIVGPLDSGTTVRLLTPTPARPRATTVPLLVSTSLHVVVGAVLLVLGSLGLTTAEERLDVIDPDVQPIRLVYLALPGPGGGGGGGGMKMPTPPPKAERKGPAKISSPIPARRLPPPVTPPPPRPEPPPPPLEARTLPPVMAPVEPVAAEARNQEGLMKEMPKEAPPSQGSGAGGGAGSGQGTGLGEGNGSGIGPGEGGGIGGGPYRPGSGVSPPRLLREVRADYTDEARRANITGEVLLEIVVRRDGTVGDVRFLRRLDPGLDQRAVQAVRQWRFAPATLRGVAVDVIVEVGVEFKLR
ncbi:MAG TPA: energy transducer TonB [Vicinamibacterales bacterium]|nr:energy transducer TonB [Vicinamibacterales bacterium]